MQKYTEFCVFDFGYKKMEIRMFDFVCKKIYEILVFDAGHKKGRNLCLNTDTKVTEASQLFKK